MTTSLKVPPMIVCLSGSLKGCTLNPPGDHIIFGTDPASEIRFPPSDKRPVGERHAEMVRDDDGWLIRSLVDEPIILNDTPVKKARLRQNDLFRLGHRGPLCRFHERTEEMGTKSFRQILMDSAAFSREEVRDVRRSSRVGTFARQVIRDAVDHGTRRLKIGVLLGGVLLAVALGLGVFQSIQSAKRADELAELKERNQHLQRRQEQSEGRLANSEERLAATEAYNQRLLTQLGFEREQREQLSGTLGEMMKKLDSDQATIRTLLATSNTVTAEVDRLRGEVDAARDIRRRFGRGVAMIAVGIAFFHEDTKRFVRKIPEDQPAVGTSGITLGGDGPRVIEWVTGSGFLVDDRGLLISNRHVIDPWWSDDRFGRGLLRMGFKPVRIAFLAFFPGLEEPLHLQRVGNADTVDIAFARVQNIDPEWKLPVLRLPDDAHRSAEGDKALLLGFPEGVQGLVNILEDRLTDQLKGLDISNLGELLRAIARRGGIRPSMTVGVISNITTESFVYDAVTTSGGSGGPLFNASGLVIGINTAVSREFTGHNFAVTIRAAQEVMDSDELHEERPDASEIPLVDAVEAPDPDKKAKDEDNSTTPATDDPKSPAGGR